MLIYWSMISSISLTNLHNVIGHIIMINSITSCNLLCQLLLVLCFLPVTPDEDPVPLTIQVLLDRHLLAAPPAPAMQAFQ